MKRRTCKIVIGILGTMLLISILAAGYFAYMFVNVMDVVRTYSEDNQELENTVTDYKKQLESLNSQLVRVSKERNQFKSEVESCDERIGSVINEARSTCDEILDISLRKMRDTLQQACIDTIEEYGCTNQNLFSAIIEESNKEYSLG